MYFMVHADVPFTGDEEYTITQQTNDNNVKDLINQENEKSKEWFGHYKTVKRSVLLGQPERRRRTGDLIYLIKYEAWKENL